MGWREGVGGLEEGEGGGQGETYDLNWTGTEGSLSVGLKCLFFGL